MNEQILGQIEVVFNEILTAYSRMADLYEEKKQNLVKLNPEALKLTDNLILETNDLLVDLNNERLRILQQLGVEEMNVSEIIEEAEKIGSPKVDFFKDFKVKINEVSKKITLLEQTNVELIEHGLTMSNKVLDIIIQACTPQSTGYDCHGKNSQSTNLGLSSVCEDA